jgi:hypothetical protein
LYNCAEHRRQEHEKKNFTLRRKDMHLGRVIEHFSGITGTLANQDELTSGDMFCEVMRNAFCLRRTRPADD